MHSEPQIQRKHLDSGLTLVTQRVESAPVVALQIWFHVGGFDELQHERGLAHLHEHMLFKGTPTRGVGQIASEIEACGGQINAWTSHDQTVYHAVTPSHAWRRGLEVLADAACHSLFDGGELEREIEVVVEEIKRAEDHPGRIGYRRLFEMVFAEHPYSLPVLGTIESVRGMTHDRMRSFYDKHYVCNNTTVVATGDIDNTEVETAVEELFGDLARRTPPERKPATCGPGTAAASLIEATFSESRLIYAFAAPNLHHQDVPALDVLAIILGQGDSSRLFCSIRQQDQLANDIGCSCYTPERGGMFSVSLTTDRVRIDQAYERSLQVLGELLATGVSRQEVEKARNIIVAEATYKLETMQGLANSLGYYSVVCDNPRWEKDYHEAVKRVSQADVLRVARRYLVATGIQVVRLLGQPTEGENVELLDSDALLELASKHLAATWTMPLAARERDIVEGIERIRLPSGDELLAMVGQDVPVLSLRVATLGGLRAEGPADNGRSTLLADLLNRGTTHRSGDEIAELVDRLAADVSGFAGRNSIGMSTIGLAHQQRQLVEVLADCLFHHDLPERELEVQRKAQLESIRHKSDAPARTAFRLALSNLYGEHPYALDSLGTHLSVSDLGRDDLLAHGRSVLSPGRLVWACAGAVDVDDLVAQIGELSPTDRLASALPAPPAVSPPREVKRIRATTDKSQAHVILAFLGTTLANEDRFALGVLSTILAGQGGRLFLELRDKQSLCYSVSASNIDGVDPGYFAFYIGTSPDKVQTALDGLYGEIDKVLQSAVDEVEIDRARSFLAGAHAIGLQRSSSRASAICFNHLYGLDRQAYRTHLEKLLAVTPDDILRVARKTLTVGQHVETVLSQEQSTAA